MTHPVTENIKFQIEPSCYEIHVKEPIESRWSAWFEGMTVGQAENGETVITGPVIDKSALHGLLALIGEMNLTLVSVRRIEASDSQIGENHEK